MEVLNVGRLDVVSRVTEHMDCSIVPYIHTIVDDGMVYLVEEADSDYDGGSGGYRRISMWGPSKPQTEN